MIPRSGILRKAKWLLLALLATVLAVGACQAPGFLQVELPNDGPRVATSQAAAMRFAEKVANAGERAAESKRLRITVTEGEVTSFLNIGSEMSSQLKALYGVDSLAQLSQLQRQQALQNVEGLPEWAGLLDRAQGSLGLELPDGALRVTIREAEVRFERTGQMIVRGYGEVLGLRLPLRLVMAPRASAGELVLDFVEGTLGPLSVPEGIVDLVGKGLARLILAGNDYVEVSKIDVSDGSLTLSGQYLR
ncbi:MAG: hypothetical protein PVH95_06935 [Anaerolineae bacterium]